MPRKKLTNDRNSISDYLNYDWPNDCEQASSVTIGGKEWLLGPCIGKGSFATVSIAISAEHKDEPFHQLLSEHNLMVIKSFKQNESFNMSKKVLRIYKKAYNEEYPEYLKQEKFSHLYSRNGSKTHVLMPLFPGSLELLVDDMSAKGTKYFSPVRSLLACIAVLRALDFYHQTKYAHCDIKAANIQYDEITTKAHIIDPDLSRKFKHKKTLNTEDKVSGTLPYVAPERFFTEGGYSYRSDYYAIAPVLYALMGTDIGTVLEDKNEFVLMLFGINAFAQQAFTFNKTHVNHHFNEKEVERITRHIARLCNNDWRKRPKSLKRTIQAFESILTKYLERYQKEHANKMQPVFSEIQKYMTHSGSPIHRAPCPQNKTDPEMFLPAQKAAI